MDSDGGYPYTNSTDRKMEFYYGGTPAEGRRYEKEDVEYFIMLGEPKEIMAGFSKITGDVYKRQSNRPSEQLGIHPK